MLGNQVMRIPTMQETPFVRTGQTPLPADVFLDNPLLILPPAS